MRRACLVPLVFALAGGVLVSAAQRPVQKGLFNRLYAAYIAGDWDVVARTPIPQSMSFPDHDLEAAIVRWRKDWRPINSVFLLELSWRWGGGLLGRARGMVMDRPAPLGRDAAADAFEAAWHKAAVSYLEGLRSPEALDTQEAAALAFRMTAVRASPADPRIVDPWVELTLGIAGEQWTIETPGTLASFGPSAIEHFDKAAAFDTTRAEALVRKASLLVRLNRPDEAVQTLAAVATSDEVLRYWRLLLRGRALTALGRPDEAVREYRAALSLVPHAQAPVSALASLEMRRGHPDDALQWATAGRVNTEAVDPWWEYNAGEHRFLKARLDALRAMVKP